MIEFKHFVTELFDRNYSDIKLTKSTFTDEAYYTYTFSVNGTKFTVNILYEDNQLSIEFMVVNGGGLHSELTHLMGASGSIEVFSRVVWCVKKAIKAHPDATIVFEPSDDTPSRIKLYKALASRLARALNRPMTDHHGTFVIGD